MDQQRHRILIVDDDRLVRAMMHDVFSNEFDVDTASSGEEALNKLQENPVSAILCDQVMPGMLGTEVLVKCIEMQPNAVRIMISATDDVTHARDAINIARVHRFIVKPVREIEVIGIVEGAIREQQLEQENARLLKELQDREKELERELSIRNEELLHVMRQLRERDEPAAP